MSQGFPTDNLRNTERVETAPQSGVTETIGITYVPSSETSSLRRIVGEAELQMIQRTLEHTGWNRKRAAAQLKISYRGLLYKIRRHGITPPLANE